MKFTSFRKPTRGLLVVLALVGICFSAGTSQAGFFYDYPYPDTDWLVLETDHFIIYYYPEVEWTAKMLAKYIEISYPKVTGLFDFPLKEKLHIVVRDQEENANGWAAYMFDQITAWATPGYWVMRGRQEWLPDMITHEFTHMVSLKAQDWKGEGSVVVVASGLVEDGVHDIDFGGQILFGSSNPFFWTEGIAEYGTHMTGFNWWTTSRDMVQRMSMLEDNYLSYEEMFEVYSRDGTWDRERGYQQGYAMGLYVMEKYGKEKYAQLALNSAQKGHLVWDKNIEEVLGVEGPALYQGWVKWMKDRYQRQVAPILQEERVGRDFLITSLAEEVDLEESLPDGRTKVAVGKRHYEDPVPEDEEEAKELEEARKKEKVKYEYWTKDQRKQKFEKTRTLSSPRMSPDGKYFAYTHRLGIRVIPLELKDWPFFSGRYLATKKSEDVADKTKDIPDSAGGYDFSPDSKKILFASPGCPDTWLPCISPDGYFRYDLYEYDVESEDIERITYRLRGFNPRYSQDGKKIAFTRLTDGQTYLGIFPADAREVRDDGSCEINGETRENCITWLIKKHDGTQIGQPSFSPDGSKIVVDIYRNRQQDVWMLNADGSGLIPLTWDKAEDRDGQFSPDGKSIIFVSDRTGIFNTYQMNLETKEVKQLTNVLGGTFNPFMTPSGDLLYSYFNSYGMRIYGQKKENFYNKPIDAGYQVSPEEVASNLAYEEPLPEIREASESYNPFSPRNWTPAIGVPMFIYERKGIQVGGQVVITDSLDKHSLFGYTLLGQEQIFALFYNNRFWYPEFSIGWYSVEIAYDFAQGFWLSDKVDTRAEPHFNQPVTYKNRQAYDVGTAGIGYKLSDEIELQGTYYYRYLTSKRASGGKEEAFLTNNTYELEVKYENLNRYRGEADINPRGGRKINLTYAFTRSGLPTMRWADVEWLGRENAPGDNSDDYTFHEVQFGYTEYIPVTWWNENGQHTLELHLRAGVQSRNVTDFDEFYAGSLHPLRWVPTQSTTHEFAGYEAFSLRGETMLVLGVSYRFPFLRYIDAKLGPFYFVSLWGEISATAGNLWGFTGDYNRDKYGNIMRNPDSYWDPDVKPGTIRRERPFFDLASKTGNYMLYDIGFTLKLKAFIFGDNSWNSFFRVAYGLNDVISSGEVNGDDTYIDAYPNDALYAEKERKGIRLSIGIGCNFD